MRARAAAGIAIAVLIGSVTVNADVRTARVFSDNMVLQQELPVAVWGWADAGEKVTVEFRGQSLSTRAGDDGGWRVDLPAMTADGQPHALKVKGNNTIAYNNVMLGEVWLASGQSNMASNVRITDRHPNIRLCYRNRTTRGVIPVERDYIEDDKIGWCECTPEALKSTPPLRLGWWGERIGRRYFYGEVAYVFGRRIHEALKVPVGLLQIAVGNSKAASWTPKDGIEKEYPFNRVVEGRFLGRRPGLMYQSQLVPIVPFTIRGVIWYQGESEGRNGAYAEDLARMIRSWRALWGRGDMPFYMVQIAQTTHAGGMLGVWEAQVGVVQSVPHTGLAPSNTLQDKSMRVDEGDPKRGIPGTGWPIVAGSNPHPPNKQIVAERLADIALAKTYGFLDREVFGPVYESHEIEGDKIIVRFKHAGSGLTTDDGEAPNWFEISDGSRSSDDPDAAIVYVKAKAKITGSDTIEVGSPEVGEPKHVRFAWHTLARHNLANREGLPAIPFRTDDLPQMWGRR